MATQISNLTLTLTVDDEGNSVLTFGNNTGYSVSITFSTSNLYVQDNYGCEVRNAKLHIFATNSSAPDPEDPTAVQAFHDSWKYIGAASFFANAATPLETGQVNSNSLSDLTITKEGFEFELSSTTNITFALTGTVYKNGTNKGFSQMADNWRTVGQSSLSSKVSTQMMPEAPAMN